MYANEDVWLTQKMMGTLYNVETHTVNYHLKKIFSDSELAEDAVIRKFRITAKDGKTYDTKHYNLSAIIAVGYKVNSEQAVQFRKWATLVIKEFTIKAYVMDDEHLKNDGSILGKKYFEEQLECIREIRLSERKFYQKITDIYATAIDYDVTATATKRFFATVQNKLHWAIHGQTVAEVVYNHADAQKYIDQFNSKQEEQKRVKLDRLASQQEGQKRIKLARNALEQKDCRMAMKYASKVLEAEPNNKEGQYILETSRKQCEQNIPELISKGLKYYKKQDMENALAVFQSVLEVDANNNTTSIAYIKKIKQQLKTIKSLK